MFTTVKYNDRVFVIMQTSQLRALVRQSDIMLLEEISAGNVSCPKGTKTTITLTNQTKIHTTCTFDELFNLFYPQ